MAMEITIPRLGWSMEEGMFGEWLKEDGDLVEAGDAIFTLESEKALQEVESIDGGVLRILPDGPQEGETVLVGKIIGFLLDEGEEMPELSDDSQAAQPAGNDSPAVSFPVSSDVRHVKSVNGLPTISPRAARAARELGVDWTQLSGSGRTGRIRERDVRAAAGSSKSMQETVRPPGALRRVIAERMMQSVQNTAPVTLTIRVEATNLVGLRNQFKSAGDSESVPALQDIVVKIAAMALQRHPELNSRWTDAGIVQPHGIHIGLAVDTEAGLVVPVVYDVEQLSLRKLTLQTCDLIGRARLRQCTEDELRGGTFTVTNLGAFGIDAFTPIINSPETAILGIGAIRREAVVLEDDRIVPRDQMTLSLTFDHRIVDGAPAARFLQTLREGIENPSAWLIG